jgi:hypothetical protein
MVDAIDPTTTISFTKQLDRTLIEMELINQRLEDHDNCIVVTERNMLLLSLSMLSPPSVQM